MEYPEGWDLEWVAVDNSDCVAVFTTAGEGPVPVQGFERYSSDEFCETLWGMPQTSDYKLLVKSPRPDDYIAFARKGFYSFDWADVHKRYFKSNKYEIQSMPLNPIKLDDLPAVIRNTVEKIRIPVIFSELSRIDVCSYLDCKCKA